MFISSVLKFFFQTLKDILRVISAVENRVLAGSLSVGREGGVALLYRLIHISTHLNSPIISDDHLLSWRLGLLGSSCCISNVSIHKFIGNLLVFSGRFVHPWVVDCLSEGESLVNKGLEHACNQIPESIAEERSTLKIRVLFPKFIKFLLSKKLPKVKKVAFHLKWRASGKELKKNYTERKHICRNSFKWLVHENFRGHVAIGACFIKKPDTIVIKVTLRQPKICDSDVKSVVKQDVPWF